MANKKISELTELTSVADDDYIAIVDASTGTTKKATVNLLPDNDTIYTHPTTHSISEVSGLQTALDGKTTQVYVDTAVAGIVDTAPATLDTLNELAAALGDDANYASTITSALAGKVDDGQVLTDVPSGALFTDTIYSHPSGDGNLHVPATSTTNDGKILTAGSTAGSIAWQDAPVSLPAQSSTTVDKYLQSDGTSASWQEVIGGASAINELNDATVSTTDPTITTNPIATGQLWVNKTSGECYVCTDNTTDANIWTNIGGGSGNVSPNDPPVITGLTVDGTLLSTPYVWADVSTGSTNTYTIAGATDTETAAASLVYSITDIKEGGVTSTKLTATGGVAGDDNVTLTVASITSDATITFKITVTDTDSGASSSVQQSINLIAEAFTEITPTGHDSTLTNGDYKYITFIGDGSFVVNTAGSGGNAIDTIEYLIVAGGGGGGAGWYGGGGGAGGFRTASAYTITAQTYTVDVGAGGNGSTNTSGALGTGSASSITPTTGSAIESSGGGGGGNRVTPADGADGGSGGGAGLNTATGGSGNLGGYTPSEGNDGGDYWGGGGGGAGSVGGFRTGSPYGGDGGDGSQSSITGTATYYAGGGGGGTSESPATSGGSSIGGDGAYPTVNATVGSANTGSGGGGGSNSTGCSPCTGESAGANGADGIVIVRYKFQHTA